MARKATLACAALICALALQGCSVDVPRHTLGNWEGKPNYLTEFQFVQPGKAETSAILNSCNDPDMSPALQCSGNGYCRDFFDMVKGADPSAPRLSFCECNRDYADPECRTARKSQLTAFVLSLFFGIFGVDQLYLGYGWYGIAKLLTVGGGGLWYLFDLCRIGSSPVVTHYNFRVAADLPHFAFVLTVVTVMLFFGFVIAIRSIQSQRVKKAHELLLLRAEQQEEEEDHKPAPRPIEPQYSMKPTAAPLRSTSFTGYGATINPTVPINRMMVPPVTLPPMMVPPVTLPPVGTISPVTSPRFMSQAPVMTIPSPRLVSQAPVATLPPVAMPPTMSRSFTPPVQTMPPLSVASFPPAPPVQTFQPVTLPMQGMLPPTEYSVAQSGMRSPVSPAMPALSSPMLPVAQRMTPPGSMVFAPGTTGIMPVSSMLSPTGRVS